MQLHKSTHLSVSHIIPSLGANIFDKSYKKQLHTLQSPKFQEEDWYCVPICVEIFKEVMDDNG